MSTLTTFRQGNILARYPHDPRTHGGVCVALCDHWLARIRRQHQQPVAERLAHLEAAFPQIMQHQIRYGEIRNQQSREEARKQVGQAVGLDYDMDHTVVTRAMTGLAGVRAKIIGDLGYIGVGATWSLRFAPRFVDGDIVREGHAIAGFHSGTRQGPFMRSQIHLFDPNLGEYVGQLGETDAMLSDMFSHFRQYRNVEEVYRTTEN